MIFYADSLDNQLLKAHGKPMSDLSLYGADLFVSPFALKPLSFDMFQSQIASGGKLIKVISGSDLFGEGQITHLSKMRQFKAMPHQLVLIIQDSPENLTECNRLMREWNENGGSSYFILPSSDLYLFVSQFEKELGRVPMDGRMTLRTLPHVTDEIANRLSKYGLGNALQALTVSTISSTERLRELTGLDHKQVADIRKWFALEDGFEVSVYRPSQNELADRNEHDTLYNDFVQLANEVGGVVR